MSLLSSEYTGIRVSTVSGLNTSTTQLDSSLLAARGVDYLVKTNADLAALNAMPANSLDGKVIGLDASATFTGILSITATGATIKSVGAGPGALFELRDTIDPGDWTVNGTYANCYDVTITLPNSVKMSGNFWVDEQMITQTSTIAATGATVERFYVSNWTGSSATLTYHTLSDPRGSGKVCKYSARTIGVEVTGDGNHLQNAWTMGSGSQDGGFKLTGEGCRVTGGEYNGGSRHNGYSGVDPVLTNVAFRWGRNDLEPPGNGNSYVCNQATITGRSITTSNCTFDGSGYNSTAITGAYGHGSTYDTLFGTVTHINNTHINFGGYETCASNMLVDGGTLSSSQLILSGQRTNSVTVVRNMNGQVNRAVNAGLPGTFTFQSNTLTVAALAAGFYRSTVSAADATLNITDENITFEAEEVVGNPSHAIFWTRGAVSVASSTFGPALCCPIDTFLRVGVSQTGAITSNRNTYPIGSSFELNGTTYNTLDAFQAAGFDTGSVEGSIPTPSSFDTFDRPDETLDVSPGWTGTGGTPGSMGVRSNALAVLTTSQRLYTRPTTGSTDHYARAIVAGLPASAGPGLAIRAADQNNCLVLRWTTTGYSFQAIIGGVVTTDGAIAGITPAVGDDVIYGIRGAVAYAYSKPVGASSYRRLFLRNTSNITNIANLANNTLAGVLSRTSTINPWIDIFYCGPL